MGESAYCTLIEAGIKRPEDVAELDADELEAKTELGAKKCKQLCYSARQLLKEETETYKTATSLGIEVNDGVVKLPGHEEDVLVDGEEETLVKEDAAAETNTPSEADPEVSTETPPESVSEKEQSAGA